MSSMVFTNSYRNLKMTDAAAVLNDKGGPAKSCRFAVHINPPRLLTGGIASSTARDLTYLCEAVDMPGRGFLSADVQYYGPNQKLPVRTQYEDITLTFICRTQSYERQFFDDWMEIINPSNTFDFNFREEYETKIEIMQFAEYAAPYSTRVGGASSGGRPMEEYRITLFNAYPLLINPQPMTWADDQIQRLAVTFTYHKWQRVGRDKKADASSGQLIDGAETIYGKTTPIKPYNF